MFARRVPPVREGAVGTPPFGLRRFRVPGRDALPPSVPLPLTETLRGSLILDECEMFGLLLHFVCDTLQWDNFFRVNN